MRKLFLPIALLLSTTTIYGQMDTSAYLQNSIQANKSYYIGKPLNVLLNDLQIEVKSYMDVLPLPSPRSDYHRQDCTVFSIKQGNSDEDAHEN